VRTANDPVLVTGCSTGIGRAVALALVKRGHLVYATARRPETLDELKAARAVEAEHGAVGTLINNAGFAKYGAFENIPIDEARRQFETNVFGLARLTQLVLPGMRKAGRGRILNVSSMGGRLAMPLGTWYHASKWAVEALSDTLRQEVAGLGIDVVIIEPGPVRSAFDATLDSEYVSGSDDTYADLEQASRTLFATAYASRWTIDPDRAARHFVKAVEAKRPRRRYLSTAVGRFSVHTRRLGGAGVWDRLVRMQFRPALRAARRARQASAER
jgi:short-subunit dehydrogenase